MSDAIKQAVDRLQRYKSGGDFLQVWVPKQPDERYTSHAAGIAEGLKQRDEKLLADAHVELHANPLPFILSLLPEAKWEEIDRDHYQWRAGVATYDIRQMSRSWCYDINKSDFWKICPSLEAGQAECRADFERRVGEIFQAPAVLAKADKIGGASDRGTGQAG